MPGRVRVAAHHDGIDLMPWYIAVAIGPNWTGTTQKVWIDSNEGETSDDILDKITIDKDMFDFLSVYMLVTPTPVIQAEVLNTPMWVPTEYGQAEGSEQEEEA